MERLAQVEELKSFYAQQSYRKGDAVEYNSGGKYHCRRLLGETFLWRLAVAMNQLYCRVLCPCHRYEHGIQHTALHPSMRPSPCFRRGNYDASVVYEEAKEDLQFTLL